ncbi:MAG TPA: sodium-dependent bicarbonate transport family permease, partial [Planctomycetaceae bacterium]
NGDLPEAGHKAGGGAFNAELLREVFLNPGLFLLFGGIAIGWISRLQGHKVTDVDDSLFVQLFQGLLCLFLLEMGMTASKRLVDLKTAGWRFIVFGLVAPNVFAITGICVAHTFAVVTHEPLQLGTYALFAVLCGAASYIAVPAIQRLAIPEASPTLPLAASLGLTFSYNVTVGIPVYIMVAQIILRTFPVAT